MKNSVWKRVRCAKQTLAIFEPQRPNRLTDAVRQVRRGSMKPTTDQSSSDLHFRVGSGSSLSSFSHVGSLEVDIQSKKTAPTSYHSTGTALAKVFTAVRLSRSSEQTWKPQDHGHSTTVQLPTKPGLPFCSLREKSYKSSHIHPDLLY